MSDIYWLDRAAGVLYDAHERIFDTTSRTWRKTTDRVTGDPLDVIAAATWLQRESGHPQRVPIGVIGPRDTAPAQLEVAREVGELLGGCGFTMICGGRGGIMQAACEGVARSGGISIGLLPEPDAANANPYLTVAIATGIGEARNALIARAALCLVAIGDSFGTLSEVALGRQFGKVVIGLAGAAQVDGVIHVQSAREAVGIVSEVALGRMGHEEAVGSATSRRTT
jgi:uncharacterized protein (TIGR00725 family)